MYLVSEQQAVELVMKCNAIKKDTDPAVYARIEELVKQVVNKKMLSNDEINQLYKEINFASLEDFDKLYQNEEENVWAQETALVQNEDEDGTEKQKKGARNHLLLCSRANLRMIEDLRCCIKQIASAEKKLFQSRDRF